MGGIRHLVGIDPDEASRDTRVEAVEVLRLPFGAAAAECLANQRRQEFHEFA